MRDGEEDSWKKEQSLARTMEDVEESDNIMQRTKYLK